MKGEEQNKMEVAEGGDGKENRDIVGHEQIDVEDLSGNGKREGYVGEGRLGLNGDHKRSQKMNEEQEKEKEKEGKERGRESSFNGNEWVEEKRWRGRQG